MNTYMPKELGLKGPYRISARVYDMPIPLNKDLDNMHIYYKAFLDLLQDRGMIISDNKMHVTQAGGFRYTPINSISERKLVFTIERETSELISQQLMYNLEPKEVVRVSEDQIKTIGFEYVYLSSSKGASPGEIRYDVDHKLVDANFGKTKVLKGYAEKIFKSMFRFAINYNKHIIVSEEFYRIHAERIKIHFLDKGVPVYIKY